jgi:hypothetical protein
LPDYAEPKPATACTNSNALEACKLRSNQSSRNKGTKLPL